MHKNFNFFVASSALSLLGIEIYHIALPLLALSLGLDPVEISWCVFAFTVRLFLSKLSPQLSLKKPIKFVHLKLVKQAGCYVQFYLLCV